MHYEDKCPQCGTKKNVNTNWLSKERDKFQRGYNRKLREVRQLKRIIADLGGQSALDELDKKPQARRKKNEKVKTD